ncbi:MAG: PLP-dependent transferase [Pseudomonadota bacterium]
MNNNHKDVFGAAATIVAYDEPHIAGAVVPPIFQNSLFTFSSFEEMAETYAGQKTRPVYSRGLNPTVRAFEEKIAALEGCDDALGFASGMAAISSAVLSVVRPGDRIVAVEHLYPDAFRFFEMVLRDLDIMVDYVDGRDIAAVERAMPGARVLYLESPTSWMFHTHDLSSLAAIARRHGAVSMIDNSWASPVFQNPARLGCDVVIHSASKYLGGHSDVVAGIVAGSAEFIARLRTHILPYLGGKLSAFEAWLLLRGLRTLPARMREHQRSALMIAQKLADHPETVFLHHPGLAGPLPDGLNGTSGLFSLEFSPRINIPAFCNALRIFKIGVSWGGHESLVVPAQVTRVQTGGPNSALRFGVPEQLVRLHIGLENPDDQWSDLKQAIGASLR